ncbi:MAG: hypothetical protein AAB467_03545 [Patescibacteria group bacterium]
MLKLKYFILSSLALGAFILAPLANAADYGPISDAWQQLGYAAGPTGAGYGQAVDARLIVSNIIRLAMSLVATIIFCLMVYAGYQWMTAGGNEEQIQTSKRTIFNSTLGLIIILAAYGITILVTNLALGRNLGNSTSGNTPSGFTPW